MDPRSRFTRAATCTAFCLVIAAAALSCRANPVSKTRMKGPATLEIAVGGVVPPAPSRSPRAARFVPGVSPAILPSTATIRVVVEDEGGDRTTASSAYSGAGAVRVDDLPAGEELSIEVAALNADGEVLTSWTGTETLERGANSLAATLVPASVIELPTRTVSLGAETLQASVTLDAGGAAFYRIPLDCSAGGEYQILYDTGKARWAWMGVYDDSWLPLEVVCSDQSQGWAVVSLPADAITAVNIALANSVASPGYPAGSMTGALQTRHAVFAVPNGTGTGTSADPSSEPRPSEDGQSLFARAATFTTDTSFSMTGDIRLYGGFSADWKSRSGRTSMTSNATGYLETVLFTNSTGCIDTFYISGPPVSDVVSESTGLSISAAGSFVVSDCVLNGNVATALFTTTFNTVSTGLYLGSGNPEIASCSISGGVVNTNSGIEGTTRGVALYNEAEPMTAYIHNCSIDGGSATTSSYTYAHGIYAYGESAAVVAACTVWGGNSQTSGESYAASYGIRLEGGVQGSVVSSCVVSGGCSAGYSASSYGIWTNEEETAILVGCTVDSGFAGSSSYIYAYAVTIENNSFTANSGVNCGNILLSSSTYDAGITECCIASLFETAEYSFERVTGNSIIACDEEMYYNPDGIAPGTIAGDSTATYKNNNTFDLSASPASWFRSYPAAPTTYAEFLAVDWRPETASSSGESPQTWGGSPDYFDTYPALGFDLAGNVRTFSGIWNRGAYQ